MVSERDDGVCAATGRSAAIDALLHEALGGRVPIDVTATLVERFRRGDGAAAGARVATAADAADAVDAAGARRHRWVAAALALLGVGIVIGVSLLQRSAAVLPAHGGSPDVGAQDPGPQTPPTPRRVLVADLAQLQSLLPDVATLRIEAQWLHVPAIATRIDIAGVPIEALADDRARVLAALRDDARKERPAGWEWENVLTFQLRDGRYFEMARGRRQGDRLVLGLRGLQGDLSVGPAGAATIDELLHTATVVARHTGGIVTSSSDLAGPEALAANSAALRLYGVGDADLAHLQRFTALKSLDVSGLAGSLGREGLAHIGRCGTLESLRIGGEFHDLDLLHLRRLLELRELDLRDVTGFTGEGFQHYSLSSLMRAGPHTIDLSGVELTDKGLHELATWGVLSLRLQRCRVAIDGDGGRELLNARQPFALDLSHSRLGPAQLQALAAATSLSALVLDDCGLDDTALRSLAATKSPLRSVSLRQNGVSAEGVQALLAIPTLVEVDVRDVVPLDIEALRRAGGDRVAFKQ